jgi:hypothetical protein
MIDAQYAELQRFHRATEYLADHWDELFERYPEQWIAILVIVQTGRSEGAGLPSR